MMIRRSVYRSLFICLLPAFLWAGGVGCARLPNIFETIEDVSSSDSIPGIMSSRGLLSPKKSKAIIDRLKHAVPSTDIMERQSAVMKSVGDSALTQGNKVTLLLDGQSTYAAMYKALEGAKDHINLESFTLSADEVGNKIADLLLQKRAQGVRVNVIYDSVGSYDTPASFFERLREGGIQTVEFNPVNPLKATGSMNLTHRDHRKLLIVDGIIAITGGTNISEQSSKKFSGGREFEDVNLPWRDTDIQIEGPAVAEYQKLFLNTWSKHNGSALSDGSYFPAPKERGKALVQVVGSSPGKDNRITFVMYVSAITFAEHSIHLTNAYFVPDDQTLDALTAAARRGVDVKVIVPSTTDSQLALSAQRYNYSELLQSGVKLYEHRDSLLHAKTAVVDGVWSTIGSANLDFWSAASNDESNAIILSDEFAAQMERVFADDLADSKEIRCEEWKHRPLLLKLKEHWAHLFSHWL
jgi:cardiolipin synthase A/B